MSPYRSSHHRLAQTAIRQCEILSNVRRGQVIAATLGQEELGFEVVRVEHAIVLTQDCDLEQDYAVRFVKPTPGSDKLLPAVLLAVVRPATDVYATVAASNRKQWDRLNIEKNKNERFHFLQKVDRADDRLGTGLNEQTIDFKRYFTVPTDELYLRIERNDTQRRCVLLSPYLEHLSSRFAYYLSRVGLPSDHASE